MRIFGLLSVLMNSVGVAAPGGGGGGGATPADSGGEAGGESTELVPSGGGGQVHDAEFVDDNAGGDQSQQVTRSERLVQNGKLTEKSGRAVINSLRGAFPQNPQYVQHVTQALILADRFRREFPGGFKELNDLRNGIQNYGGDSGLKQIKANADYFNELNEAYLSASPKFIEEMTSDPRDPANAEQLQQAFIRNIPAIVSRWAQLDAPGRAWWTADQFARGLDSVRMPVLVARMADLLRTNSASLPVGMTEAFDEMVAALEAISYSAAKNKPQPPAQDPKLNDERGRLQAERTAAVKDSWQTSLGAIRKDIFTTELSRLLGARVLTPLERQEVKGYYDMWIRPKAMARQANIDRFLANNDREGYLATERAFYAKEIPTALRNATAKLAPVGGNGKPRQQQRAAPAARSQTPATPGTVRVATMPGNINAADRRNTTELLRENKGWGKDGKLYAWQR